MLAKPDLVVSSVSAPASDQTNLDGSYTFSVSYTVVNQSPSEALGNQSGIYDRVYVSTDATWDASDAQCHSYYHTTLVAPGGSYTRTVTCSAPVLAAGEYHVIVRADALGYLPESNESNNATAAPITLLAKPDLVVSSVSAPASDQAILNGIYTVSFTVTNAGPSAALGNQSGIYDRVYISKDGTWDASDAWCQTYYHTTQVPPGGSYSRAVSCNSALSGSHYLIVRTDALNGVPESNEGNNQAAVAVTPPAKRGPADSIPGVVAATTNAKPLAFSRNGLRMAAASGTQVVLLDAVGRSVRGSLVGHSSNVAGLAYAPTGAHVLTGSGDGTARIWDSVTAQQQVSLATVSGQPGPVAYSHDGAWALAGAGTEARLYDVANRSLLLALTGNTAAVRSVALSPDGALAITGCDDGSVKVFETTHGTGVLSITGHTARVVWSEFSPDGAKIWTASQDATIRSWDAATGQQLSSLGLVFAPEGVALSTDGKYLATYYATDSLGPCLWDLESETLAVSYSLDAAPRVTGVAFSPDQTRLATTNSDGSVRFYDTGLTPVVEGAATPIAAGGQATLTVEPNQLYLVRVDTAQDQPLVVNFAGTPGPNAQYASTDPESTALRVVVSEGAAPSNYAYQWLREAAVSSPTTELPIDWTRGTQYYALISAPQLTAGYLTVVVSATADPFHLSSVEPKLASNAGNVTLRVHGTGLSSMTDLHLVSPSQTVVPAQTQRRFPRDEVFATFNLSGAEVGSYALRVVRFPDNVVETLPGAITVQAGAAGQLSYAIDGPSAMRPDRKYVFKLVAENTGGSDLPSPFVQIRASSQGILRAQCDNTPLTHLTNLMAPVGWPGDVMPAHSKVTVSFCVVTPHNGQAVTLSTEVVSENGETFDWAAAQSAWPVGHAPPDWLLVESRIGTYKSEVFSTLRQVGSWNRGPGELGSLLMNAMVTEADFTN